MASHIASIKLVVGLNVKPCSGRWRCSKMVYSTYLLQKHSHGHIGLSTREYSSTNSVRDKSLVFEAGRLGWQADGACMVQQGNTTVMSYVVSVDTVYNNPIFEWKRLQVDYSEPASAVNIIPRSRNRRDKMHSRPIFLTEVIDRAIRPFLKADQQSLTKVVCQPVSADGSSDPDICAINAASAALVLSDIPFDGPVGAVRVGMLDGKLVSNPTVEQMSESELEMVFAGTTDKVAMVDFKAWGVVDEMKIAAAFDIAQQEVQKSILAQQDIQKRVGKDIRDVPVRDLALAMRSRAEIICACSLKRTIQDRNLTPLMLRRAISEIMMSTIEQLRIHFTFAQKAELVTVFNEVLTSLVKEDIFTFAQRTDRRGLLDIRSFTAEVDVFPYLHGSSIVSLGETQVFSVSCIDSADMIKPVDEVSALVRQEEPGPFILDYEEPSYSLNALEDTNKLAVIGTESLIESALGPQISTVIAEGTCSVRTEAKLDSADGSHASAATIAANMSLMDAGIPVKESVAAVSCGWIKPQDHNENHTFLLDLSELEEQCVDAILTLAKSSEAIKAFRVATKTPVAISSLRTAISYASSGADELLAAMNEVLASPKQPVRPIPVADVVKIEQDRVQEFIGSKGHAVMSLEKRTGSRISVKQHSSDGMAKVTIVAPDAISLNLAIEEVNDFNSRTRDSKLTRTSMPTKTQMARENRRSNSKKKIMLNDGLNQLGRGKSLRHRPGDDSGNLDGLTSQSRQASRESEDRDINPSCKLRQLWQRLFG